MLLMNMRNYSALLLAINSSKGTAQIIAVLHFTVTVGSLKMSKTHTLGCFCPKFVRRYPYSAFENT